MASETFHGGAGLAGFLMAILGIGTVIGGLARRAPRARARAIVIAAAAVLGTALADRGGAARRSSCSRSRSFRSARWPCSSARRANAHMQLSSAPHLRGRVMAIYMLLTLGTTVVGGPFVGWVCQHFNPAPASGSRDSRRLPRRRSSRSRPTCDSVRPPAGRGAIHDELNTDSVQLDADHRLPDRAEIGGGRVAARADREPHLARARPDRPRPRAPVRPARDRRSTPRDPGSVPAAVHHQHVGTAVEVHAPRPVGEDRRHAVDRVQADGNVALLARPATGEAQYRERLHAAADARTNRRPASRD